MIFQIGIGIAIANSISDEDRDRDRDLDFGDRGHALRYKIFCVSWFKDGRSQSSLDTHTTLKKSWKLKSVSRSFHRKNSECEFKFLAFCNDAVKLSIPIKFFRFFAHFEQWVKTHKERLHIGIAHRGIGPIQCLGVPQAFSMFI